MILTIKAPGTARTILATALPSIGWATFGADLIADCARRMGVAVSALDFSVTRAV